MGCFKDSEKALVFPEEDAGALVVPKPVKPKVGAAVLVANGVDTDEGVPLDAGKVKAELALVPVAAAEDTLAVVVVVTVENRAEGVVPNVSGFETGALRRDDAKAGEPVVPNEKPGVDEETVADAEEAGVLLFRNDKPEEAVELGAVEKENPGTDEAVDAGNESPGAEECVVEAALEKKNPGAEAAELEVLRFKENAEVDVDEPGNENPGAEEAELEVLADDEANEDPKRPEVDPKLVPNKDDEVPPVVVAEEDVEDPNMLAEEAPVPNKDEVEAAVGAVVDDPN